MLTSYTDFRKPLHIACSALLLTLISDQDLLIYKLLSFAVVALLEPLIPGEWCISTCSYRESLTSHEDILPVRVRTLHSTRQRGLVLLGLRTVTSVHEPVPSVY